MARNQILQSNFNSGELTPRIYVRSDMQRFFSGQAHNENFQLLIQGGAKKRGGSFCDGFTPSNNKSRLYGFFKSYADALILEFSEFKMRVWQPDYNLVMDGSSIYELVTPYSEGDIKYLNFTQASDVIFITDQRCSIQPKALLRLANNNWQIVDLNCQNGPFQGLDNNGTTLTASGVTGSITLTASGPIFDASKIGNIYRLRENIGNPPVKKWEAEKTITSGELRQNAGRVYQAISSGTSGTTPPIHWEGTVSDGAISWKFMHDGAGIVLITGITNTAIATGTVLVQLPTTNATTFWEEGSFGVGNGYPACSTIHQERFFFGQTLKEPDTFFATVSGGYTPKSLDFKPGLGTGLVVDSDAIKRSVTGGEVRPILHLVSAGALYAFTPKSIEVITGPSDKEPITPAGAAAISRPGSGSNSLVQPIRGPEEILYVSASGHSLMAMPWSDQTGDGRARNLSVLAEHIGKLGKFIGIALIEGPEPCIYVLNDAGQLFCVCYMPQEEVLGWWRITFADNAKVESIATLRRENGDDELWMCVNRKINNITKRTIEHFGQVLLPTQSRDLANYLDGAYFFNLWNMDNNKYVTITPIVDTDEFYINASDAIFNSGDFEKEFWLRQDTIVDDSVISIFPVKLQIIEFISSTLVKAKAITNIPDDFIIKHIYRYAKPVKVLSGIDLWANTYIDVFSEGENYQVTVDLDGSINFPNYVARGTIGKKYDAKMQLMPLDAGSEIGTAIGSKVRIDKLTLFVRDAVGLSVGPKNGEKQVLSFRSIKEIMTNPAQPNDKIKKTEYPGYWDDVVDVEIIASGPYPCEIAGLSIRVNIDA